MSIDRYHQRRFCPANCDFADEAIVALQRMAPSTGRTAATQITGQWRQRAVLINAIRPWTQDAAVAPMAAMKSKPTDAARAQRA